MTVAELLDMTPHEAFKQFLKVADFTTEKRPECPPEENIFLWWKKHPSPPGNPYDVEETEKGTTYTLPGGYSGFVWVITFDPAGQLVEYGAYE